MRHPWWRWERAPVVESHRDWQLRTMRNDIRVGVVLAVVGGVATVSALIWILR